MTSPFRGTYSALITPFNKDSSVDFGALEALVEWQIQEGIDGLVPCGTTGESATLTLSERHEIISRVVKIAAGRIKVIGGTGGNNTQAVAELQKSVADTGADATLVVTPYYNKPTPEGLFRHYEKVAEAADIPVVLYNVPGRTGVDMKPDTVARIATIPGIIGVKEATADLDRVAAIREATRPDFAILSGDDETALPFVLLGGDGVISVTSNVEPAKMSSMIRDAFAAKNESALLTHRSLRPLFEAMFFESNPIPVKAALAIRGRIGENYRLPLVKMSSISRERLEAVL